MRPRVIPVLLLEKGGLIKTTQFSKPVYIGDPINAVKIFNDKEVDELAILDIHASNEKREPNYAHLAEIVSESFMPLAYGGAISSIQTIEKLTKIGIEKMIINTAAFQQPHFISEAAREFGSSTIVVSVDVKKNIWGKYQVHLSNGKVNTKQDVSSYLNTIQDLGAGEIILTSIDREGTMKGYDTDLIKKASENLHIPLIAQGGAAGLDDFKKAIDAGASAVAAGSMFVFYGKLRGILINYPSVQDLKAL
jgi:imidazole glycerol-phosphate synthase subunit HisF